MQNGIHEECGAFGAAVSDHGILRQRDGGGLVNARFIPDIDPGEIVVFGSEGAKTDRGYCGCKPCLCVFE